MTERHAPLRESLAALVAWTNAPTSRHRDALRRAMDQAAVERALAGWWLQVDAPPLPGGSLGGGTLSGGPTDDGMLLRSDLHAEQGTVGIGELIVDADAEPSHEDVEQLVLAIELALEAAWARAAARQVAERMAALDAATRAITSVLDLETVLQLMVDRVRELAEARYAALGIVDMEGQIERFITSGMDLAVRARIGDPPRGRGLLGLIIREGRSYVIPDITDDPRRSGFPPGHPPMQSFIGVPVVVRDTPVGNLYLTDREDGRPFGAADLELVEAFARHAAIAVENARLHDRIGQLAVAAERGRIGRDLHDGIIQSIYAVALGLEDAAEVAVEQPAVMRERIDRAIDALHGTIRDLRNYIFGLRPELLVQAGLVGGLHALADEVHVNTLLDIEVETTGVDDLVVTVAATQELLSIAREALSNVTRHAHATRARVELEATDGEVRLVVADNGRGMPAASASRSEHQGMGNMRDRARALGGAMRVERGTPPGTRIIITVPLTRIQSRQGDEAAVEAPTS